MQSKVIEVHVLVCQVNGKCMSCCVVILTLSGECLYNTETQLFKRLRDFTKCPSAARRKAQTLDVRVVLCRLTCLHVVLRMQLYTCTCMYMYMYMYTVLYICNVRRQAYHRYAYFQLKLERFSWKTLKPAFTELLKASNEQASA